MASHATICRVAQSATRPREYKFLENEKNEEKKWKKNFIAKCNCRERTRTTYNNTVGHCHIATINSLPPWYRLAILECLVIYARGLASFVLRHIRVRRDLTSARGFVVLRNDLPEPSQWRIRRVEETRPVDSYSSISPAMATALNEDVNRT